MGCSKRVADALSHCPFKLSCDLKSESDSDEVEVVSYSSVCVTIDQCLNGSRIPKDLNHEAQDIGCVVQSIVKEKDKAEMVRGLNAISLFKKIYTLKHDG